MNGPLAGVKVVELTVAVAGPAAGTILADWGADVIKLEPLDGDPFRAHVDTSLFEMDNRSKRSMTLNLRDPEGAAIGRTLLASADVFLTNLRPTALQRLKLDYESLAADMPRLVYGAISGFGEQGDGADRPGYDLGAFWARSGIGYALTMTDGIPPVPRPGMGDHTTAISAAGGIAAALVARDRTGRGQFVSASLLRSGSYVLSADLVSSLHGQKRPPGLRRMMFNPMIACYRAGDGKWFWLLGVQPTRHFPNVCKAIGQPDLISDPRFDTMEGVMRNGEAILAILDEAFATRSLDEWAVRFAEHDVWFDPQQSFDEVLTDPLVLAAGVVREAEEGARPTIATPVDFSLDGTVTPKRFPELGEHTEFILEELGYDWDTIIRLKTTGTIG